MCDCGSETETTDHFFLRCPFFMINRQKLPNGLLNKDLSISNLKDEYSNNYNSGSFLKKKKKII